MRYIRVIKDGFIYDYNEILAKNPSCEVIEEAEVIPPQEVVEEVVAKRGKRKGLNLATADIPEAPPHTPPELAADAARKWPK